MEKEDNIHNYSDEYRISSIERLDTYLRKLFTTLRLNKYDIYMLTYSAYYMADTIFKPSAEHRTYTIGFALYHNDMSPAAYNIRKAIKQLIDNDEYYATLKVFISSEVVKNEVFVLHKSVINTNHDGLLDNVHKKGKIYTSRKCRYNRVRVEGNTPMVISSIEGGVEVNYCLSRLMSCWRDSNLHNLLMIVFFYKQYCISNHKWLYVRKAFSYIMPLELLNIIYEYVVADELRNLTCILGYKSIDVCINKLMVSGAFNVLNRYCNGGLMLDAMANLIDDQYDGYVNMMYTAFKRVPAEDGEHSIEYFILNPIHCSTVRDIDVIHNTYNMINKQVATCDILYMLHSRFDSHILYNGLSQLHWMPELSDMLFDCVLTSKTSVYLRGERLGEIGNYYTNTCFDLTFIINAMSEISTCPTPGFPYMIHAIQRIVEEGLMSRGGVPDLSPDIAYKYRKLCTYPEKPISYNIYICYYYLIHSISEYYKDDLIILTYNLKHVVYMILNDAEFSILYDTKDPDFSEYIEVNSLQMMWYYYIFCCCEALLDEVQHGAYTDVADLLFGNEDIDDTLVSILSKLRMVTKKYFYGWLLVSPFTSIDPRSDGTMNKIIKQIPVHLITKEFTSCSWLK